MDELRPRPALTPWHLLIVAFLLGSAITAAVAVWFIYRVVVPGSDSISITRDFTEYLPTVGPTDGILETATSSVPETFTQSDSSWLFNMIPLGTTVSEIRVPAVYRYYIQIFDSWRLISRGQVCIVMAPQFYPNLPPSIITGKMEKSTSAGWLRFDSQENLDNLESGITEELNRRADDKTHRDYVREACRQSVATFVKSWLMKEDYWRTDRFHQIIVVFPDDPPIPAPEDHQPTVTLETQPESSH